MAREPPADPDRYEEAIEALRRRVGMTDPEFRQLEEDARVRAFWVAGVTQARLVQEVKDALERAVANGTTLEDFQEEMGGKLAEAWGGEDSNRVETVFRNGVMSAYNGGRTEVFDDPVVREARPFLRFDAVGDSRTTDICDALDGTVLPADDPFWESHTPPLHHNCRSVVTPLSVEEAEGEGITKGKPDTGGAAPAEGFGRPQRAGEVAKPDISGFDKEIREVLQGRFKEAPPPPPEPAEPEHARNLLRLPPTPIDGDLDTPAPIRLEPAPGQSAERFVEENQPALRRLAAEANRVTGTGPGVEKVQVSPLGYVLGVFDAKTRKLTMSTKSMEEMTEALRAGVVKTEAQRAGIKTYLHESLHAASNEHRYTAEDNIALEEATTELLAQHYIRSFITKTLGLKDASPKTYEAGTYKPSPKGQSISISRPVSYPRQVLAFGEVVRYVDAIDLTKTTAEDFNRHVAGRALQVKRQAGALERDARFGLLARPVLDREGIKPDHPRYRRIADGVEGAIRKAMAKKSTKTLDADVAQAVGRAKGKKKGRRRDG